MLNTRTKRLFAISMVTFGLGCVGNETETLGGSPPVGPSDMTQPNTDSEPSSRLDAGEPTGPIMPVETGPDLERGALLYGVYCGFCHGDEGQGYTSDNANALNNANFLASATDEFLESSIVNGRPGTPMSGWGRAQGGPLRSSDVANVLAYIRTWQTDLTVELGGPSDGSVARGEAVYQVHCTGCHGEDGQGVTALSLSNPWFLTEVGDGFLRYAIEDGRPGTPMPGYTDILSGQEIEDVVAFIRSWERPVDSLEPVEYVPDLSDPILNPDGDDPSFDLRLDDNGTPKFVSVDAVHEAIQAGQKVVMLDARAHGDFLYGHITGAISLPFYLLDEHFDDLPQDVWIINYCGCPHAVSGQAWEALKAAGFEKTAVLDEGYYVWRDRGYPVSGADSARMTE